MENGTIKTEDARIDALSQKILLSLDNAAEPQAAATIANDLGVNRQNVWYRLREHLSAADLVTSTQETPDSWTRSDGPYWALSATGSMWVDARRNELEKPKSIDEMGEMTLQALEKAADANSKMESHSTGIRQLRKRTTSIENELDDLREKDELTPEDEVHLQELVADRVRQDIKADLDMMSAQIGDIGKIDLQECKTIADALVKIIKGLDNHQASLENQSAALDTLESDMEDIRVALTEMDAEVDEIESRLRAEEESLF